VVLIMGRYMIDPLIIIIFNNNIGVYCIKIKYYDSIIIIIVYL